ncbi:TRAP transporter large permease [Granulosicoccus antarcticus]|uniref:TRAP transporter large permease protein n=1 Tax=Granulosicoccus antarcticus IMCC3135 TaxID=1192854 RepID=A0A2Z2P8S4_9GAMM|nr:TRAP transporter large permease [Granulosicoccus antarcticus]ASJ76284.1 Sialic acid TRAP transporter large permease protein SiaM [Granulosicoccus antarcticus IMCC3135]
MSEFFPIFALLLGIAIGMPVAFAIAAAGLLFFVFSGAMPSEVFVQRLVSVTHSFPLLAVPLFIMTGVVMNFAGITQRMMNFAESLTGHWVGGLAQVNVMLSTLLGGVAGSANADAAMQSKILVPEMTRRGYDPAFSSAVTAASSVISVIIPPGIGLIIYGFMGDVSIGRLFLAGIVPGLMLCMLMMLTVGLIAKRAKLEPAYAHRATGRERLRALRGASLALMVPFGIVIGIRFGFFTPTEAGAMAVLFSTIVGLIYRELHWRDIQPILQQTIQATAIVLLIICAANAFGFYMTWEEIPKRVADGMLALSQNPYILLLLINLLLIGVGMFVEGTAALIILAPILVPVVIQVGIDPVHFGIVMVLNLTIAGVTPPLGTLMFTTCAITGVSIGNFIRAAVPFYIMLFLALMILTFVPAVSLWLPDLWM